MFLMDRVEKLRNNEPVSKWMKTDAIWLSGDDIIEEVRGIFENTTIVGIPVVDNNHLFLGLISKPVVMNQLTNKTNSYQLASQLMQVECDIIHPQTSIEEASKFQVSCLPVVDDDGFLVGIITRKDIIKANEFFVNQAKEQFDYGTTLKLVLNSAYEGIVVVNLDGNIQEINEVYCRLLNCRPEDVIGKPVVDVIENTRLNIIIKTGIEERGIIQRIAGMDLVVHRLPIFSDRRLIGAIEMLVFKEISEINAIYEEHHALKQLNQDHSKLKKQPNQAILDQIIGESPKMIKAKQNAIKAANGSSNIIIRGASGTGKEVFARAIHNMSDFSRGQFVAVNCAAIPENLLESELFGYVDGAFTDAKQGGKKGKFEIANNGTIFLDEIGDMSFALQAKLLRVLQERTIEPVGSVEQRKINVQIISATHRNLEKKVAEGTFREDLYYRINVIPLDLPNLAERREDISLLLHKFIREFCRELAVPLKRFSVEAEACLTNYNWPGNVRELQNICEALVVLTDSNIIDVLDLPKQIRNYQFKDLRHPELSLLQKQEQKLIFRTLTKYKGNKTAVAKALGISRSTLYNKLNDYQIN